MGISETGLNQKLTTIETNTNRLQAIETSIAAVQTSIAVVETNTRDISGVGVQQPPVSRFAVYGAAGTESLIEIPVGDGQIIHISDILISGDVAGYGWLEFDGVVRWGRMNFPARSGWAQQFKGDLTLTGDGENLVTVRVYLRAAGRGDASILYSLQG